MAELKSLYHHRNILLVWSVFEALLLSAIVYGWAALVMVLKQEHFFQDLCQARGGPNSSRSDTDNCVPQEQRLNLVFLAGAMSFSGSGVFSGPFLDRFGPRKTRFLSSFLFGLSFLCFLLADKDRGYWLFPGAILLSAAGLSLLLTIFQVANLFDKWKSSVLSLFNGAVDSSGIVLLFFKLAFDAGVPLRLIVIIYFLFALIAVFVLTFILPPNTITSNLIREVMRRPGDPESSEHDGTNEHVDKPLVEVEGETHLYGTINGGKEPRSGWGRTQEKSGESPKDDEDLPISLHCLQGSSQEIDEDEDVEDINTESCEDSAPPLMSLVFTAEYILSVLFLSVCKIRLWFYVDSLNSYLEFMGDNDTVTVSRYTNCYGAIQFAGFIFAPIVGFAMDWKPKKKRNQKTDIGFVVAFLLTSCIALLLNILVLIPVLPVQYASFVAQVVLRAFNYAVFTAFILHKFPLSHFGKLYGTGHLIAAALGSTQYGLFSVVENSLEQDPFWVNFSLLVSCLFLNVLPAVLWFKERRKEKQDNENDMKHLVP